MPATGRNLPLRPSTPFASSEVEMPLGLGVTSMGVSSSLDTNGKRGASALHPIPDIRRQFRRNDSKRPEAADPTRNGEIGRASCWERACQYGSIAVVDEPLNNKNPQ